MLFENKIMPNYIFSFLNEQHLNYYKNKEYEKTDFEFFIYFLIMMDDLLLVA